MRKNGFSFYTALLAVFLWSAAARADTIQVNSVLDDAEIRFALPDPEPECAPEECPDQWDTGEEICTLRGALARASVGLDNGCHEQSDANGSALTTINLPAGFYYLTRQQVAPGEDLFSGDLDIFNNIVIHCVDGSELTFLSARPGADAEIANNRVFWVHEEGALTLIGCSVRDGQAERGGGILNEGNLTLDQTIVSGNSATGVGVNDGGGGIFSSGHLEIIEWSVIRENTALNRGGGVRNSGTSAALVIRESSVERNTAIFGGEASIGGGIYNDGRLIIEESTVLGNEADLAGGLFNDCPRGQPCQRALITASVFEENRAQQGAGILNRVALADDPDTADVDESLNPALILETTTVSSNEASDSGGAIFISVGTMEVRDGRINSNRAAENGGAVFLRAGSRLNVINTEISENRVTVGSGTNGNGGAIYCQGCDLRLERVRAFNNTAIDGGGVLFNYGVDGRSGPGTEIIGSTFDGNQAARGGAILSYVASEMSDRFGLVVRTSNFFRNRALLEGGIANGGALFVDNGGTVLVERSTFSENNATHDGGAVYLGLGRFVLFNSTLADNWAGRSGGAVHNLSGELIVNSSTIAYNRAGTVPGAGGSGGGIRTGEEGTTTLANAILAINFLGESQTAGGVGSDFVNTITSRGNNVVGVTAGSNWVAGSQDVIGGSWLNEDTTRENNALLEPSLTEEREGVFVLRPPAGSILLNVRVVSAETEEGSLETDQRGETREGGFVSGAYQPRCGDNVVSGNEVCGQPEEGTLPATAIVCEADCTSATTTVITGGVTRTIGGETRIIRETPVVVDVREVGDVVQWPGATGGAGGTGGAGAPGGGGCALLPGQTSSAQTLWIFIPLLWVLFFLRQSKYRRLQLLPDRQTDLPADCGYSRPFSD